MAEINMVTQGNEDFQFVTNGAVVLNAEYEETGRLLNSTEAIALERHQVAQLRDLTINVEGSLDG